MEWLFLSLLPNFLFAASAVNDKGFISSYSKNFKSYIVLANIVSTVLTLPLLPFSKIFLPFSLIFLLFINGLLNVLGIVFWFLGLSKDDVSRNVILFNINVVFTIFLSIIFLSEQFSFQKSLGISFFILAGVFASISPKNMTISSAAFPMVLSALTIAGSNVLTKFVLNYLDPVSLIFWTKLWAGITLLPLLFFIKSDNGFKKVYRLIGLNEFIRLLGLLVFVWAVKLGTPSLVVAVGSVYQIFVLTLEIVYSTVLPNFVPAELDKKSLTLKLFSIILIIVGITVVSRN